MDIRARTPRREATRRTLSWVAVLGTLGAIGLLAGCSDDSGSGGGSGADQAASTGKGASGALQREYQSAIKKVLPSVVEIKAGKSLGSGIVYDSKGHIVTNAHVISDQRSYTVTLATGSKRKHASLVASNPKQDLAVIKLDDPPKNLTPASFGSTKNVQVGEIVLAMGNPLGLSSTVTQGIVSATGRTITEPKSAGGPSATISGMVQTSAAINPGNSGGALVGLDNKVIGINTLAATDPEVSHGSAPGIGFAIPAGTVTTVADKIIKTGKAPSTTGASLGVVVRTVIGKNLEPAGAGVVRVVDDGPADDAGLRDGDLVTKLGDTTVSSASDLRLAVDQLKPGDKKKVEFRRAGKRKSVRVTLGKPHAQGENAD